MLRHVHNRARINLATSQAMVRELERHGFRNVELWPRGVDTEAFHPRRRTAAMRTRLAGGQADRIVLLYAGRLAVEKQLDRLLPVLASQPGVTVAFVGDGPDRARLERLFADLPAVFTGFLQGAELAEAYASADAFLFPSTTETLGLVLLEAVASGLPVVAARSAPTLELFGDDDTGAAVLFDPADPASLLAAVARLAADVPAHRERAARARERAGEWDWQVPTRHLVGLYETIARDRQAQSDRPSIARARLE